MTKSKISRVERKANKSKRVAFFRNEMNKAWIGAKKSKNPKRKMNQASTRIQNQYKNERETVIAGLLEWWERNEQKVDRLEKRLAN